VYANPEKVKRRALGMWLVFMPTPFLIARIGAIVGAPISDHILTQWGHFCRGLPAATPWLGRENPT